MTAAPEIDPARLVSVSLDDPERFTDVYDRYFPAIHRYVAGRLGAQAADDVVAETFLAAFRRRRTYDAAKGAVLAWLYGIATNLIAQHRRAETRRYRALARLGTEPAAGGHEDRVVGAVTAAGMRQDLARALTRLSRKERDVVLLVALADLKHEEIAAVLGVPYGTVGSRLNRARRKLRAALSLPTETDHG